MQKLFNKYTSLGDTFQLCRVALVKPATTTRMITVRLIAVKTLFKTADSLIPMTNSTRNNTSLLFRAQKFIFNFHLPVTKRHKLIANRSAYSESAPACNGKYLMKNFFISKSINESK